MTLTAPPFRPQTCQVVWPGAQVQGTCDLRRDVSAPYHVGGRSVTPVALVELWLSGDDLPAAVRERTLANISATLRAVPLRTTVPAGEYVATGLDADGQITSQRVATPLYADLVVTPDSLGSYGDQFCQDSGCVPLPAAATASWAVFTGVSDQWQFTPLSGGQALRSALSPPSWFLRLVLTADSVNGWDVDQQRTEQLNGFGLPFALPATVCRAGADVLSTRVTPNPPPGPPSPQQYSPSVVSDHGLAGCELRLTNASGASGGSFIWRFGVLLAADAQAQALMPDLPLAPPSALAAVGAASLAQP
jgi:hypothetical protein